jgi:hypothetical protein
MAKAVARAVQTDKTCIVCKAGCHIDQFENIKCKGGLHHGDRHRGHTIASCCTVILRTACTFWSNSN